MKFRNVLTCSQAEQALRLWGKRWKTMTSASSEDSAVFPGLQYHSDWTGPNDFTEATKRGIEEETMGQKVQGGAP